MKIWYPLFMMVLSAVCLLVVSYRYTETLSSGWVISIILFSIGYSGWTFFALWETLDGDF